MTLDKLTKIFNNLGAKSPELWAKSQLEEGINQLGRFILIRGLWDCIVSAKSTNWIDYELKNESDTPHGKAMQEMLDSGVSKETIATLIRVKQSEAIREACYILEDYTSVAQNSDPETGEEYVKWGVRELNENEEATDKPVDGLHESFWNIDPEIE